MPTSPLGLTTPGLLAALCLVVVTGATTIALTFLFWRASGGGARKWQSKQAAQLDELHRLVSELSAGKTDPPKTG
jgi:hypothetical protein